MNSIQQIALAATLCIAGAAHADTVVNSFVVQNDWAGVQGEYNSQFTIADVGKDSFTETPVTHVAGDTFVDDYYFNLPESSGVGFSIAAGSASDAGVSFASAILYTATGSYTYSFATTSFTPTAISGSGLSLTSGEYALEVIGTTLVDGGTYAGVLDGVPGDFVGSAPAVPEPAEAAMLLAGAAMVAGGLRRRVARRASGLANA